MITQQIYRLLLKKKKKQPMNIYIESKTFQVTEQELMHSVFIGADSSHSLIFSGKI